MPVRGTFVASWNGVVAAGILWLESFGNSILNEGLGILLISGAFVSVYSALG